MIPHFLRNVSLAGRKHLHQATQPAQPTNQPFTIGMSEMEGLAVQFLTPFANSPSWENTLSLVNEHHQTLAHLAVLFRYTTLLDKVAEWGINVDVQDVNGFTALHCAYMCGDLDSARILKSYGADEDVRDDLGRRPSDMYIPRANDPEKSSPSSARTSSSSPIPNAGEDDWEKLSTASGTGSLVDYVTTMDLPASVHQPVHTHESATSSRIIPASLSIPSPACGSSNATDDAGLIYRVGKLRLSDSPISLEPSPPSTPFPVVPVTHSGSGPCIPAAAHQSMPIVTTEHGHSCPQTPSSNPTPRLSTSEASSQGRVHNVDRSLCSPPPLIPSMQMPVPTPSQCYIPASRSSSSLGPQAAHSASLHRVSPGPGTGAAPDYRPVTHTPSTGAFRRFDPPPQPPPASSGPKSASTYLSILLDVKLPAYEEGPQRFSGDKKSEAHEPEKSKEDAVRSSAEKGKQRFTVSVEREKLVEDIPASGEKRLFDQAVPEVSRFRDLRPGDA